MRRTTVLALAIALPVLLAAFLAPTGAQAGDAADGKAVFLAQKCNLCHSIDALSIARVSKAEKTKGPDLGGVAKRHDEAWINAFLNKKQDLNGKKHLKTFTGTPQELDALVAWLLKQ